MAQIVGTGAQETYGDAIAGVWTDLRATLARLEALAADPAETLSDADAVERLGGLQYSLHRAAELVTGLDPPLGAELEHEELATALTDARDATAEVAYVLEAGDLEAVESYVYEWRGTLFHVRLARLRLSTPAEQPSTISAVPEPSPRRVLITWALAGAGALVLAAGAIAGQWLLAAVGLTAFALGALTRGW